MNFNIYGTIIVLMLSTPYEVEPLKSTIELHSDQSQDNLQIPKRQAWFNSKIVGIDRENHLNDDSVWERNEKSVIDTNGTHLVDTIDGKKLSKDNLGVVESENIENSLADDDDYEYEYEYLDHETYIKIKQNNVLTIGGKKSSKDDLDLIKSEKDDSFAADHYEYEYEHEYEDEYDYNYLEYETCSTNKQDNEDHIDNLGGYEYLSMNTTMKTAEARTVVVWNVVGEIREIYEDEYEYEYEYESEYGTKNQNENDFESEDMLSFVHFDDHAIRSDGTIFKYIDHEGSIIPEEGISAIDSNGYVWTLYPDHTEENSSFVF